MKLAAIEYGGSQRWGVVEGNKISLNPTGVTLLDAINSGTLLKSIVHSGECISVDEATYLPVIENPGKIICVGLNYETHRKETGRAVVAHPTIFTRFSDSQTGHNCDILLPPESDDLDYEGELAVVIGKGGRRISRENALDHIVGYSCYNDGSVRDWQSHTIQFTPGKNWPRTGSFGPWLVTPDEFGPPLEQCLRTRLNGQVMQEALLSDMIFSVPALITYVSTFTPLSPGDVIVSGTPGGVGAKRDPKVFMKEGDIVEVEIDRIGTLRNTIRRAT